MEQQKALNALAPYLALTHSASSPRAVAELIERATSAANTFVFAELLETPQIRALTSSESHCQYYKLLEIFSHGTYNTYHTTPSLPTLNAPQTLKLRQLSFLTLAKYPENLSYANLKRDLGLETHRQVEDLVISVIYAGLVEGTLDPYHERVVVTSISPLRDLEPNSIPGMLKALDRWSGRCVSTLTELEKQILKIKNDAWKRYKDEATRDEEVATLVNGISVKDEGCNLPGGNSTKSDVNLLSDHSLDTIEDDAEAMEIDEADPIEKSHTQPTKSGRKRGLGAR